MIKKKPSPGCLGEAESEIRYICYTLALGKSGFPPHTSTVGLVHQRCVKVVARVRILDSWSWSATTRATRKGVTDAL